MLIATVGPWHHGCQKELSSNRAYLKSSRDVEGRAQSDIRLQTRRLKYGSTRAEK
jgi:hypothetical protein